MDLRHLPLLLIGLLTGCHGEEDSRPPSIASLPPLPALEGAGEAPRGAERDPVELMIALVGEVRGEIEPCGCPTLPYGGFARRETLLNELRAEGTLFHLDAGETLLKGFSTTRLNQEARSELLLELSAVVGVDVWAPGPTDLAAIGIAGLQNAPMPVTVANWAGPDGEPLLPGSVVVERDGLKLGVIGLSAAPSDPKIAALIQVRDPVEAAREALAALPEGLDLVVALGSIEDEDAARVGAMVPGLAAVLTTRGGEHDAPHSAPDGGALLVEAPDRGRYLEVIEVRLGSDAGQPLQLLLSARDWRALHTMRAQREQDPALAAALAEQEALFAAVGAGRNLAQVESIPLSASLDAPGQSAAPVEAFKDGVLAAAAQAAAQKTTPAEPGFAGGGACVRCHSKEVARWALTDHAHAWRSLVVREQTGDVECVGCHSTGFGQPGGFGELTRASIDRYNDVQCEACHGPNRVHVMDQSEHGPPITEQTCITCHDEANSPGFDYETYLRRATCQSPEIQ